RIRLRDRPAARARRSADHAAQLGLAPVPRDLIWGPTGHVDPLPSPPEAAPGAFRVTRDGPTASPHVQAHDASGHRAAAALLEKLDELSRRASGRAFTGQVLVDGS